MHRSSTQRQFFLFASYKGRERLQKCRNRITNERNKDNKRQRRFLGGNASCDFFGYDNLQPKIWVPRFKKNIFSLYHFPEDGINMSLQNTISTHAPAYENTVTQQTTILSHECV